MNSPRHPLSALLLCGLLLLIPNAPAPAGSATWNLNPTSGDWNTAANWTPNTVPNGPSDTATFDFSTTTDISTSDQTEVDSIVFNPGASAYTITLRGLTQDSLFINGTGIVNNSGVPQTFVSSDDIFGHAIYFFNNATAGNLTVFYNPSIKRAEGWFTTTFLDSSNAGNCTIMNAGGPGGFGGQAEFFNQSSAENATIINEGAPRGDVIGGATYFFENATAGTARITNNGGTATGEGGGLTEFFNDSTAADGTFINHGASTEGANGGLTEFSGGTSGNATLIADGTFSGYGAGRIAFPYSSGGAARVELFGTGALEISTSIARSVTVGSIEGDGFVFLGANNLEVGGNNLSTLFAGVIQDGGVGGGERGSLTKVGTGRLVLTNANTYTGGTITSAGGLVINNTTASCTGTGAVEIDAGTLAGSGIIAGPVTVGTGSGSGAFLSPGRGAGKAITLTIQSLLTFKADSTCTCRLNTKKTKADQVIANGVTIESGAQFHFKVTGDQELRVGKSAIVISNTSATPISGTFANLADGSTFTVGPNTFQVSYSGGDGNDLTLAVVP